MIKIYLLRSCVTQGFQVSVKRPEDKYARVGDFETMTQAQNYVLGYIAGLIENGNANFLFEKDLTEF